MSFAENWDKGVIHHYYPDDYDASRIIWSVAEDLRGVMYFSNGDGVLEFDSSNWRLLELPDNKSSSKLITAPDGRIYVGGDEEIGYLAPDAKGNMQYVTLTEFLAPNALSDRGSVLEIAALNDGALAFLFDQYLLIYKDEQFTTFYTQGFFYSLTYNKGILYILDGDQGLLKITENRLAPIPEGDFFRAHFMLPYQKNNLLIISQDKGVLIYEPALDKPENSNTPIRESFKTFELKGKDNFHNRVVMAHFSLSEKEHLLAIEEIGVELFDVGSHETRLVNESFALEGEDIFTIFQDSKGGIWLGTSNGIIVFFPEKKAPPQVVDNQTADSVKNIIPDGALKKQIEAPFAVIVRAMENIEDDEMLFGGTFFNKAGGIQTIKESILTYQVLPFEQNALRFTYSANDYEKQDKVTFQTYLEGMEDGWSKWSKRQFREYTNLSWRDYTFHVRALRSDGKISAGNSYTFEIFPPWYERWWFYAAQLSFLLSLLGLAAILRGMGIAENLSDYIIAVVVLVAFVYLDTQYENYIEDFAGDVLYIKVLLMVGAGIMVEPLQNLAKYHFSKISIGDRGLHAHNTDELTGLGDRNYFNKRMKNEIKKTRKKPRNLSIIIIDLDDFRLINDQYGMACGDAVLRQLGRVLSRTTRETDVACRYWGEKFIISLFDMDGKATASFCEQLRKAIESYEFHHDEERLQLTSSFGAAVYPDVCKDDLTLKKMMEQVNAALSHSRTMGKNRFFLAPVPTEISATEKKVNLGIEYDKDDDKDDD